MKKQTAIIIGALFALVALIALVRASGYGSGYAAPSYGQNYDRKVGYKTVIYHPYNAVSSRFDHRVYPAYSGGYSSGGYGGYSGYSAPAPYIRTGLDYTIGDVPGSYSAPAY